MTADTIDTVAGDIEVAYYQQVGKLPATTPLLRGNINGNFSPATGAFDLGGAVSVEAPIPVGTLRDGAHEALLATGRRVGVQLSEEGLQSLTGSVRLDVCKAGTQTAWARLALEDVEVSRGADGFEFSGAATFQVLAPTTFIDTKTRRIELLPGTRATATLASNQISSATGAVAFVWHTPDPQRGEMLPFVQGSAEASIDFEAAEGGITTKGAAALYLARDVEFGKPGDELTVTVQRGSGGDVSIGATGLERVAGELHAAVNWKGRMLQVDGTGEVTFDSQQKPTLKEASGRVTVTNLELFGGKAAIKELVGAFEWSE